MEKIASDKQITPQEGVKLATAGFTAVLATPTTNLNPQDVLALSTEFNKRASARMERHLKLRDTLLAHAQA